MPQDSTPDESESARKERADKIRRRIEQLKERAAGGSVPSPTPESPREKIDRLTHAPEKPEPNKPEPGKD
jgi:hypothetical protein